MNGVPVPIRMKLGESGEAFFVEEMSIYDELNDENLVTSPLPMSPAHSDNDSGLTGLKERRDTEESIDLKLINPLNPSNDSGVKIAVLDENSSKGDDQKSRKRRKKRKKNQVLFH